MATLLGETLYDDKFGHTHSRRAMRQPSFRHERVPFVILVAVLPETLEDSPPQAPDNERFSCEMPGSCDLRVPARPLRFSREMDNTNCPFFCGYAYHARVRIFAIFFSIQINRK